MKQPVTPPDDLSHLQNDTRSVDDLIRDDEAAEAMEKSSVGRAAIEYSLVRASIFWVASNVLGLEGKGLSDDGIIRTLADFAKRRGETYNTATSLQKLAPRSVQTWVRAEIARGMIAAEDEGRAYVAPSWKVFVARLLGKEPAERKPRTISDKPKAAERLRQAAETIADLERQLADRPVQQNPPQQQPPAEHQQQAPAPDQQQAPLQPSQATPDNTYEAPADQPEMRKQIRKLRTYVMQDDAYDWADFKRRFALAGQVTARWIRIAKHRNDFTLENLLQRCQDLVEILVPENIEDLPDYDGHDFIAVVDDFTPPIIRQSDPINDDDEFGYHTVFRLGNRRLIYTTQLDGWGFEIEQIGPEPDTDTELKPPETVPEAAAPDRAASPPPQRIHC